MADETVLPGLLAGVALADDAVGARIVGSEKPAAGRVIGRVGVKQADRAPDKENDEEWGDCAEKTT